MTGSSWPPPGTPPPPRPPTGPGYRSPVLLARMLLVTVAVGMIVAVAATIAVLDQMEVATQELAKPGPVAADRLAAVDARRTALCRTVQLIDVVGLGLLVVWTRRLYGNLRPLGFNEPRFREGWALGGWFVPLVNLVRPKQIVNDIWRAGDPEPPRPAQAWEEQPVSSLLSWWWFFWIVLWLPTPFLGIPAESAEDAGSAGPFFAWCGAGHMVFGALTIAVVVRTTSRQVRLATGGGGEPTGARDPGPPSAAARPRRSANACLSSPERQPRPSVPNKAPIEGFILEEQ